MKELNRPKVDPKKYWARGQRPPFPMKDELEGVYIVGCDPYTKGVAIPSLDFVFHYGTPEPANIQHIKNPAVQKTDAEVALKSRLPLDTKPVLLLKQNNDELI